MKRINKGILLVAVMSLFMFQANAQTEDAKWNFGVHGGFTGYNGDLTSGGLYDAKQFSYGFGGISLARYLTPHIDVVANGTFGHTGHVKNASNQFNARLSSAALNVRYSFFKYEDKLIRPFLFAGLGYMGFNDLNVKGDDVMNTMALPSFGAGLSFKLNDSWNFILQETFYYLDYDKIDGNSKGANDLFMQHSVGFTYNFGKAKDDDMDGIPNSKDDCPQVKGTEAMNGCPDSDGDGIADSKDACPQVAGLKEFMGCPDTDGDGVKDSEDPCPQVAGLKEFMGCPDTDGDGVQDSEDPCPKVAGLKDLMGCPDSDGDGVADKDDTCPNVKGIATMNGCPDTDSDGVADNLDKCPEVAGVAANKGCPEVKAEEIKILKEALTGVKFESGKDIIRKSSYGILNNVVKIMNDNPAYQLNIEGHTDSQGNADKNMVLSQNRAKAVKAYLVTKGIDVSRLSSKGYGITKPIADNKTSAGRALNRRVELTVKF